MDIKEQLQTATNNTFEQIGVTNMWTSIIGQRKVTFTDWSSNRNVAPCAFLLVADICIHGEGGTVAHAWHNLKKNAEFHRANLKTKHDAMTLFLGDQD